MFAKVKQNRNTVDFVWDVIGCLTCAGAALSLLPLLFALTLINKVLAKLSNLIYSYYINRSTACINRLPNSTPL